MLKSADMNKNIYQFRNYFLVGCVATASHFITLALLVELLNVWSPIASTIGFLVGATTGFNLNRIFVFEDKVEYLKKFIKYLLMSMAGAVLNFLIMAYLTKVRQYHYLIAQTFTTATIFVINFGICKLWIFKGKIDNA